MSRRAYSEINLHITWHVKDNAAVLRDEIEVQLHRYLRRRAAEEPDVICREVGGTDDHVHLVVSAQPTLLISEWVGQMKGASAHYVNKLIANRKVLEWQPGYGVVSFGTKDLPWVVDYVLNQRAHHSGGKTHVRLERIEPDDEGKPAQAGSVQ
ncbi:MAG: IS200/IS605 family transposase [Planctomycetes bacterium]|nr:IS200/IS605 family transposase [Planctomycetota bacterium]